MVEAKGWDLITRLRVHVHAGARGSQRIAPDVIPQEPPFTRLLPPLPCVFGPVSLPGLDSSGTLGWLVSRPQGSPSCLYNCVPPHLALLMWGLISKCGDLPPPTVIPISVAVVWNHWHGIQKAFGLLL